MSADRSWVSSFRRHLLGGLAVIGPLGITAFVLAWLFRTVDGFLGPWLEPIFGWSAPGVGILLLLVLLLLVGWIVERTLGARLVQIGEDLLSRVPIVRRLYGGSSRIVKAVIGEEKMAFREVVLFEHPGPGLWSFGLVTSQAPSSASGVLEDEGVTIYLPTAPNPMSGYLIITNRKNVRPTDLTPEEVFTYVVSAGSVSPGRAAALLESTESASGEPAPGSVSPSAPGA